MCAATSLAADIEAIGLLGPGMSGWPQARAVLSGSAPYQPQPTIIPSSQALPAAERRRAVRLVHVALAVSGEATAGTNMDLTTLSTVFASSAADTGTCHELLQTLATTERQVSPTRFHNSVHNIAAGYWSIASRDIGSYTMVCAYDGSFAAGLLEALSLVVSGHSPVMLVSYDVDYPTPLREKRPVLDTFAVALLLRPPSSESDSVAHLACSLNGSTAGRMQRPEFESLRLSAPAARALPLLELIAEGRHGTVGLEYLEGLTLSAVVSPCA